MVASRLLLAGFIAAASASFHEETSLFATLLKRQEPGTPAYNCHDNCGTAITISKASSDVCSDEAFLFDYQNCLQCAGPDNYNIWRYYGGSLSVAGEACGLDTEPLSGEQEDVPEAQHPGDDAEETSSSSEVAPTQTPTPTAAPVTTGATTTTDESAAPTTTEESSAPTTTGEPSAPTTTGESYVPSTTAESTLTTTGVIPTGTGVVSGAPSAPANGTATFTSSSPPEFTGAAVALHLSNAAPLFGFAVLGAAFGI